MGSSASKASRAAGSAARQYPKTPSTSTSSTSNAAAPATNAPSRPPPASGQRPGPTVRPQPHASATRDQAINLDASDPDFAQSLRSIGPVQPNPTLSPSSTFNAQQAGSGRVGPDPRSNPAIAVLSARSQLQDLAEKEFIEAGRRGHEGRQFLDIYTIRQMLIFRDQQKQKASDIERRLGLKKGVVERLGTAGVVELASEAGRADKEIRMV